MTSPSDQSITVECPRCGYALRGEVERWTDRCELSGSCPECGLQFQWGNLLNPGLSVPRWSIEYALAGWPMIAAARRTLFMMLKPWRFWTELKMVHEPRWRRIVLFWLVMLPILYAVFCFSVGSAIYIRNRNPIGTGAVLQYPPSVAGLHAALLPWSDFKNQTAPTALRVSPRQISSHYRPRIATIGWRTVRRGFDMRLIKNNAGTTFVACAFESLALIALAPVGFALLPASRRISKVRRRHIMRTAGYSVLFAVVPIAVDLHQQILAVQHRWTAELGVATFLLTAGLLVIWWSAATSRHLRIAHAWLVGFTVVGLAFLLQKTLFGALDLLLDLIWLHA